MADVQLTPRFQLALAYAYLLHADQARKGSHPDDPVVPYMGHLLGTADIVLHYGGDEDQAIAALLHDAAEDQGGRSVLDQIRARFGERVADIVDACTDTFRTPKPAWKRRKQAYIAAVAKKSADSLLVSAADKLNNVRAIVMDVRTALASRDPANATRKFWNRFNAGKDEILWYYFSLVDAFRRRNVGPIVDELEVAVRQMEELGSR
jgi:GTP pyrophosphokinase